MNTSNTSKKAYRKFLILWAGGLIASFGGGLTSFGLGVYTFQQTGLASATSMVTLFAFLPGLLLSPLAGILADRYNRLTLMILGDSLSALGLVYILFCLQQGGAQLWQICLGVSISSAFSSLLQPAYRAVVTDLLTEEQYTKASGLMQVAGSARFLLSPVVAGVLLTFADIRLLLIIDICTLFITVTASMVVRKSLPEKRKITTSSFSQELKDGFGAITQQRGVFMLAIVSSALTFFVGFIQILSTPMVISFTNSAALGTALTISACGMLVTSIFIGIVPFPRGHVKILSLSLCLAGIFMIGFALRENLVLISLFGFLFFSMLPFANMSLDFLIRTNVDNQYQGRAWGLISLITEFGSVLSYAVSGLLADYLFTPLLVDGGPWADTLIGRTFGTGAGRGTALLIALAGLLLAFTAAAIVKMPSVKKLEKSDILVQTTS